MLNNLKNLANGENSVPSKTLGVLELTEISDLNDALTIQRFLPIYAKRDDRNGYFLVNQIYDDLSQYSYAEGELDSIDRITRMHGGRFKIDSIDSSVKFYAIWNYKEDVDFIIVPEELKPTHFIKNDGSGTIGVIQFMNNYDVRGAVGEKVINTSKKNVTLVTYIGYINKLLNKSEEELTIEDLAGRWFVYDNWGSLQFGKITGIKPHGTVDRCSIQFRTYGILGDETTFSKEHNEWTSFNKLTDLLTTIVDDAYSKSALTDENGYRRMSDIKIDNIQDDFYINGDYIVESSGVPMAVMNTEKLVIAGSGSLKLIAGSQQPCIGVPTYTGMSGGRWCASYQCSLKEIVVDGINLILESKVPNFSIGTYNSNEYPKITCINGGTVTGCPEAEGERIQIVVANPPMGSTKISGHPEYIIRKEGQSDEDLLSDELRSLREDLDKLNPKWHDSVTVTTNKKHLKRAIEILALNKDADISLFFTSKIETYIVSCCVTLNSALGFNLEPKSDEFMFEILKADEVKKLIENKYYHDGLRGDRQEALAGWLIGSLYPDYDKCSDWEKLVIYELIPSYAWTYEGSNEDNARKFYAWYASNGSISNREEIVKTIR